MARQCRGCGAYLQSEDPKRLGYGPEHLWSEPGQIAICQRCYRISHYGRDDFGSVSREVALQGVKSGVNEAQAVIMVIDLMDFEGSLPQDLLQIAQGKPLVVAVNKGDLLPVKTSPEEAAQWVKSQLARLKVKGEVVVISATTGAGFAGLEENMDELGYDKWAVVGATNVGKSTLIQRMLTYAERLGGGKPTVSRFPGTTVERVQWKLPGNRALVDTPGVVPTGRLSDMVCSSCATTLIPDKKLTAKLYPFTPQTILAVEGLAVLECLAAKPEAVMIGFTASGVQWHKSSIGKKERWLQSKCRDCYLPAWVEVEETIPINHDLVIHGLGWVSTRKSEVKLTLTIPEGVAYSVRKNLVGPK